VALWRTALSRNPTAQEAAAAAAFLVSEAEHDAQEQTQPGLSPRERLAHAVLASAEFQFLD
jgi:hypothetical protein